MKLNPILTKQSKRTIRKSNDTIDNMDSLRTTIKTFDKKNR
jgi:hypothetical protein